MLSLVLFLRFLNSSPVVSMASVGEVVLLESSVDCVKDEFHSALSVATVELRSCSLLLVIADVYDEVPAEVQDSDETDASVGSSVSDDVVELRSASIISSPFSQTPICNQQFYILQQDDKTYSDFRT